MRASILCGYDRLVLDLYIHVVVLDLYIHNPIHLTSLRTNKDTLWLAQGRKLSGLLKAT